MKVMLCTPYEEGKEIVFGGITIWARNIMNYYKTRNNNVYVFVQPFDRITYVSKEISLIQRCYFGATEYLKNIRQAKLKLKEEKFDIIHLNSSANVSLVKDLMMIYIAHRFGSKLALHMHFGRIPQIYKKNNWEWKLLKQVLRRADMVITMDQKSHKLLNSKGYNNVAYLPNPLSKKIIKQIAFEKKDIAVESKSILYVGHVIRTKGVFELAAATKGLSYSSLRIVGKYSEDIKQQMLAINPKMSFIGEITHEQVIKEMLSADIFVLPSYTEGFPNVILESMACGCATIGTEVGAIPEMLDYNSPKPCGKIVPPKNVELLRNSIDTLLNNPNECDTLRERAIKRVYEMYSVDVVWEQLTYIWNKTIKNE